MQASDKQIPPEWRSTVDENIQCGLAELWILSLLAERDMYTYEIRQELIKRSQNTFRLKDGSMYGPMYRMRKRGLITARQVTVGERRVRMYYHLEETGKLYLFYAAERFRTIFKLTEALLPDDEH